jgi:nucleoside-diphosphate-sugar epimerase
LGRKNLKYVCYTQNMDIENKSNIIVTGGLGFLGQHIIKKLATLVFDDKNNVLIVGYRESHNLISDVNFV